jgi:hypothetical protein
MSEFVTGIIAGACLIQFVLLYVLNKQLIAKKEKAVADFEEALANLAEAHKSVIKGLEEVDRKATETKLKFEMTEQVRHQAQNPLRPRSV